MGRGQVVAAAIAVAALAAVAVAADESPRVGTRPTSRGTVVSAAWGEDGAAWSPRSPLPVVAWAGHADGQDPPEPARTVDASLFGAYPDDDSDDSAALQDAIDFAGELARGLFTVDLVAGTGTRGPVPADGGGPVVTVDLRAGTYDLSAQLVIAPAGVAMRGAGALETVVRVEHGFADAADAVGSLPGGRAAIVLGDPTWREDWSLETEVVAGRPAARGSRNIVVRFGEQDDVGRRLRVRQRVDRNSTPRLLRAISGGDPALPPGSDVSFWLSQEVVVTAVEQLPGDEQGWYSRFTLDRPLRFPTTDERASVDRDGQVQRAAFLERPGSWYGHNGLADLSVRLPATPYAGHFRETGQGGIEVLADHSWVTGVHVIDADNGIQVSGAHTTVSGVVLRADRDPDSLGHTGHHGIVLTGQDHLLHDFVIDTRFIHDVTVNSTQGTVVSQGWARDLTLDHHKQLPFDNVFTDLDAGAGTRLWRSGGSANSGFNAGANNAYWGIRARRDLGWPRDAGSTRWGHLRLTAVGARFGPVPAAGAAGMSPYWDPARAWIEPVAPRDLADPNLWTAQVAARSAGRFGG